MRIISTDGRYDYYDPVQKTGQDLTIVYLRKREILREYRDYGDGSIVNDTVYCGVVGFCGDLYPFVHVHYYDYSGCGSVNNLYAYDMATLDSYVESQRNAKFGAKDQVDKWFNNRYGTRSRFLRHFANQIPTQHDLKSYMEKYPIVVDYDGRIVGNETLKNFDFQKIVDPYSAFQRIQTFVSNIATPIKPIPEISNEVKLEADQRFDRWSFRKPPSAKKH